MFPSFLAAEPSRDPCKLPVAPPCSRPVSSHHYQLEVPICLLNSALRARFAQGSAVSKRYTHDCRAVSARLPQLFSWYPTLLVAATNLPLSQRSAGPCAYLTL